MVCNFSLKRLIYPPLCIHCYALIEEGRSLCVSCSALITLTKQEGRCPACFSEIEAFPCHCCSQAPIRLTKQAAAVEKTGPALSLLSAATRGERAVFPALTALLSYQWLHFNHPLPDLIIPTPSSYWTRLKIGFDPSLFLAQSLAKMWDVPALPLLSSRWDIKRFVEEGVVTSRFCLKDQERVTDRRALLVVLDFDRELVWKGAQALQLACPAHTYALAFTCGPL